jgi:hypothetical protein
VTGGGLSKRSDVTNEYCHHTRVVQKLARDLAQLQRPRARAPIEIVDDNEQPPLASQRLPDEHTEILPDPCHRTA